MDLLHTHNLVFYFGLLLFRVRKNLYRKPKIFFAESPIGELADELYVIKDLPQNRKMLSNTIKAMASFSTTPFYGLIALFIFILNRYFNG